MRFCSILFFILFSSTLFAQEATNVKFSTNDEQIVVSYDLEGKPNTIYEVSLRFEETQKAIVYKAKSVNGDVGKVESGKNKVIVWNVYKDYDELVGAISPLVIVKEIPIPSKADPTPRPTPTPPKPPIEDVNKEKDKKKKRRQRDIRNGFKVGFGNTSVDANRPNYQKQFSFEAGTYLRWQIQKRLYIQPEILYHLQSYENLLNNTESTLSKHHYLRAQALGGFAPFGWGLYFNGGIYYGYLIGGKEDQILSSGTQTIQIQDIEPMNGVDSPFLSHDLGYILGGSFSLFKGSFAIGALWSNSFNNVIDTTYYSNDVDNENLSLRNQSYHFFIQKRF